MKKFLLPLFLLFATNCWGAFPTTGVLDTFNRANATPPSANWSGNVAVCDSPQLAIVSHAVTASTTNYSADEWNASSFSNANFEEYLTMTGFNSLDTFDIWALDTPLSGPCVYDGYVLTFQPDLADQTQSTWGLALIVGGFNVATLASGVQAFNHNDSFGLRKTGTVLTVWYQPSGGAWTQIGSGTDTSSYGPLFFGIEVSNTSVTGINFGGGTVSLGTTTIHNSTIRNSTIQ